MRTAGGKKNQCDGAGSMSRICSFAKWARLACLIKLVTDYTRIKGAF
ncbi:hypothetical protein Z949_3110 [Sulfitobacter guttiformis KCTC 32187]|nr:hypothetical protein Z949_3110 [Sulfitobacter guttiformis KCTC 32187]